MTLHHYVHYSWLCIFIYTTFISGQSHCDANVYGKLLDHDCFDLFNQLPGQALSPDVDPDAHRSFVEPKFLRPQFAPVPNPYNTRMVQLPKIWRSGWLYRSDSGYSAFADMVLGTCRAALLSSADSFGTVHEPTSIDTWRTVLNAVIDSVQECVLEGRGAGGMRFANSQLTFNSSIYGHLLNGIKLTMTIVDDASAKVVYLYAPGSPFETVLNQYMSSYKTGIDPDNPYSFSKIEMALNSSTTQS